MADNILVNETLVIVKKNIAMGVKKVNSRQNSGIIIQAKATNESNVNYLTLTNSFKYDPASEDMASIFQSEALLKKTKKITGTIYGVQRVTTFIFDNEKLFSTNATHDNYSSMLLNKKLNSKILSASLKNVTLKNLTGNETVHSTFSYLKTKKGKTECVFWDFKSAGGQGSWSSWGCWSDRSSGKHHRCRCNHLTNFSILLDADNAHVSESRKEQMALSTITYIDVEFLWWGCSVPCLYFSFLESLCSFLWELQPELLNQRNFQALKRRQEAVRE